MTTKRRTTQQKQAIEAAFTNTNRPLTVNEVHELAAETCTGLGVATVYRAVNRLVEQEWLKEVHLPNQPMRYEQYSLEHHHHFQCESCERVLDIAAPCSDLGRHLPEGFQSKRHEVTFYGVCAACVAI